MNFQFHLTDCCNLRCKHCYQNDYTSNTISLNDLNFIFEKTKKYTEENNDCLLRIMLTGGEPLLVPSILDYIKLSAKYFKQVGILTNGLLLTSQFLSELKKIKEFFKIQVSLEGPKKINDIIRGQGTYDKIRYAIKLINETGINCDVSCTLASYNYDKIEELYKDLISYDSPTKLWFDRCIPFKDIKTLNKEQFYSFLDTLKRIRKEWKENNFPTEPAAVRALQFLLEDNPTSIYQCCAGQNHFTIMPNGNVMLCRRLNFAIGNLFKEDWKDIISRTKPLIKKVHTIPDECKYCKYSNLCRGGLRCLSYSEYSNFHHKDICCNGPY